MWLILQQDEPDDYVLATGETHSVREFVELAFARVGRRIDWRGKGVDEVGVDCKTGRTCWSRSTRAISGRPRSIFCSAMPAKARDKLGWDAARRLSRTWSPRWWQPTCSDRASATNR